MKFFLTQLGCSFGNRQDSGPLREVTAVEPSATRLRDTWFDDYFPRALDAHTDLMSPIEELTEMLGGASVEAVPLPHLCTSCSPSSVQPQTSSAPPAIR